MNRLLVAVCLVLSAIFFCAIATRPALTEAGVRAAADRLWNRGFAGTAIHSQKPTPFSHPGQIVIFFYAEGWYPNAVQIESGCNGAELSARIGPHRIWAGRREGPPKPSHCAPGPERRTSWLVRFFRSDPHWKLVDRRLSLSVGQIVIRLSPVVLIHPG